MSFLLPDLLFAFGLIYWYRVVRNDVGDSNFRLINMPDHFIFFEEGQVQGENGGSEISQGC